MGKYITEIGRGVFGDILAVLGFPAGGVAVGICTNFIRTKLDQAHDILMQEIASGNIDPLEAAQQDDAIAAIYRYVIAARDGAARRNLRLLARAMVGLCQRHRLFADDFNEYAEALSRLTRNEIIVVGYLHRGKKRAQPNAKLIDYWPEVMKALVPKHFDTEEHVLSVCCSAQRTGLLLNGTNFTDSAYYRTSPFMDKVSEMSDFMEVLREEGDLVFEAD